MRKHFAAILAVLALSGTAMAQNNEIKTSLIARIGFRNEVSYRLVEVYQQRGRWIYPDGGYVDFNRPGIYREFFLGGGAVLYNSKHFTVIEDGYLDQATGPASKGALYFQPWTYIGYRFTERVSGETVYFPYLPLNKAGRLQHVLERSKLEYGFKRFKVGAGYGGYQFGDDDWAHKPFVTATWKTGAGNLEVWCQRVPAGNHFQVQIRYFKLWK